MKNVAFILINYHSSAYTLACIASILKHTSSAISFQIIVVDNSSTSSDYEKLLFGTASLPVTVIRSRINLGFAGGNMYAAQHADAQYLYFLNSDCELLNDNARIFFDFMNATPNAGICSGQMFNAERNAVGSFSYFPSLKLSILGPSIMRAILPSDYPSKRIFYSEPVKVPLVSGAALFVDNAKFSQIGGFDTNLFLYCEEEDLAACMKAKGFETYHVPDGHYLHHMGKSTSRNPSIDREYYISLLYYLRKHVSYGEYSLLKMVCALKELKKCLTRRHHVSQARFVLCGAPMRDSLRFSQTISALYPAR